MGSKQAMLDDESIEILNRMKNRLPPRKGKKTTSYSDVIKYYDKNDFNTDKRVEENFDRLYEILMVHYHNPHLAHIAKNLHSVLVKAMKSNYNHELVTQCLNETMEREI